MKCQCLYFTKTGNVYDLAQAISRDFKCKCDQIPPAYPCENEKIVFIGAEGKNSKPPKQLIDFCKDLTPARTKNVAFYVVSPTGTEGASTLADIVKAKGVNVIPDVYEIQVKSGLFSKGKPSDEQIKGAVAWAKKIVDSLAD